MKPCKARHRNTRNVSKLKKENIGLLEAAQNFRIMLQQQEQDFAAEKDALINDFEHAQKHEKAEFSKTYNRYLSASTSELQGELDQIQEKSQASGFSSIQRNHLRSIDTAVSLDTTVKDLMHIKTKQSEEIKHLRNLLDAAHAEMAEKEVEHAEEYESMSTILQDACDNHQEEKARLEEEKHRAFKRIVLVVFDKEKTKKELADQKKKLNQAMEKSEELAAELNKNIEVLQTNLKQLEARNSRYWNMYKRERLEKSNLASEMEKKQDEHLQEKQSLSDDFARQLEESEMNLQSMTDSRDHELRVQQQERVRFAQDKQDLEQQLEKIRQKCDEEKQMRSDVSRFWHETTASRSALEKENLRLQEQVEKLTLQLHVGKSEATIDCEQNMPNICTAGAIGKLHSQRGCHSW